MTSFLRAKVWLKKSKSENLHHHQHTQNNSNQQKHPSTPSYLSATSSSTTSSDSLADYSTFIPFSATPDRCSPADATISAPSSASPSSVLPSFIPSPALLKKSSLANTTFPTQQPLPAPALAPRSASTQEPTSSQPVVFLSTVYQPSKATAPVSAPEPAPSAPANNSNKKNKANVTTKPIQAKIKKHLSIFATAFSNASLPSLSLHHTNNSCSSSSPLTLRPSPLQKQPQQHHRRRPSMPGFLQDMNSSFQSLPMQQQRQQLQQQRHQMQRGEDQELEADEYEYRPPNPRFRHSRHNSGSSGSASSKEKSMGLSSLGSRPHVPPLPPTAFLIVNNNNSTHHFGGSLQQPAKLLATTTTTTAAAVGNHSSGNSKLFKNFSARFNNPTTTQAIPVIETVAQQYARTIKALWQMVEDEELSYQIDAAVTAAREQAAALQQQQGRPSLQSKASEEVLHRICHEPCCVGTATSTGGAGSVRGGHRQPAHSTVRTNSSGTLIQHSKTLSSPISKQPQSQSQKQQVRDLAPQVQRQPSEEEYPSWTWGRLTSGAQPPLPSSLQEQQQTTESDNDEDEGEGSEEDREQRKRELEELERELVTLGLQRHQGPVHASATLVRHEKSSAQEPSSSSATTASRAYTSPLTVQVGAQVAQPSQGSQPQSPLKQQSIPQRRQRQRQNSLAYEERRSEQDALHRSYYTATITNNNNNNIKSSSSSSIPSTPTTVSSLSKPPAMLDFHDGILHEEESDASSNTGLSSSFSKMDEDGVVLSVAHRVTVRPRTQDLSVFQKASGPGQNRQQRPSWEVERARGRGVAASWTATTMTAAAARAQAQKQQQSSRARIGSLPTVATPSVSTMISAR